MLCEATGAASGPVRVSHVASLGFLQVVWSPYFGLRVLVTDKTTHIELQGSWALDA